MVARQRGGRVREFTTRERESTKGVDTRATRRTGVGYAHEGRLKGEKEDGIKKGKKRGVGQQERQGEKEEEGKMRV